MKTILTLFLLFLTSTLFAQNLILQKTSSQKKERVLKLNRDFIIRTADSTYYYNKILSITDSSFIIKGNEWASDSTIIPIKHIESVSRPWLKAKKPLVVIGSSLLAVSAGIALFGAPIDWASNGKKEGLETLKDAGYTAGIGISLALIGSINRKYDLAKHWKIKNKN